MRDDTFQLKIAADTIAQNAKERASHTGSDKLTASMLGQPLQWQVLKMIGVPSSPKDEYTLRKFLRGRQVEDWFANAVGLTDSQKDVEYSGVIGKLDGLYNGVPVEVKSVANMKYKWIAKRESADASHKLQGALYALATGSDEYLVAYCAADDFRVLTLRYKAASEKAKIDRIIKTVTQQLAKKVVPVFEAIEPWQEKDEYNNYLEWRDLTAEQIIQKLKKDYPEAYAKLVNTYTLKKREQVMNIIEVEE